MTTPVFQKLVWDFYRGHKRTLPWRQTADPYRIMVSEIMLQQTQASRVTHKYQEFLQAFPTARALAGAPLADVLKLWSGLGYNRRALWLQRAAKIITTEWQGKFSRDPAAWAELPGIGRATAGAICAYAFNQPAVFIETNIRRVFIHHFFRGKIAVTDREILPVVEKTLDSKRPRQWYWALMDYGSFLASRLPNPNRRSKHYTKQSKFQGSFRQLRGQIMRLAMALPSVRLSQIVKHTGRSLGETRRAVRALAAEGLLAVSHNSIKIS